MEINSHFNHLQRREINNSPPVASPVMTRRDVSNNVTNSMLDPLMREQQFQQQILQLKQQQQLQQQILLQQFQAQQQQLAEQHEKQLQQHIKEYLEQQKKLEEEARIEKERREKQKLEALKKKEKHEQSAVASSEVKQRLQEFVLNKKQREAAASSANNSPPSFKNWPMLGKYDDDFPLRKTASEPNLKVRSIIKQKVIERRSSPLLKRKDKGPVPVKRRLPLTIDTGSTTPDSSPNSPPNGTTHTASRSNSGSTPIQEEPSGSPYGSVGQGSLGDLTNLYSSPSMPNISLGRPPVPTNSTSADGLKVTPVTEAQLRAMAAARLGMPLTGHVLHPTLPFYPALPIIESEFTPPTSPAYIKQQMQALEQARSSGSSTLVGGAYPMGAMTDAQVARARLHRYRTGHKPLNRTQSAPLPLGHPVLQPQSVLMSQHQQEQYLREKQLYDQQQHNLLKQHIRQTVLTRSSSKSQVENVEEETEAAVAQEMKDVEKQPVLIDLTENKTGDSELVKQQRDREAFLQQQRDLMMRPLQISEGSAFTPQHHAGRPLSRTFSSPLVSLSTSGSSQETSPTIKYTFTTGIVYDSLMLKHQCICGNNSQHPEHGGRLQSIWARLQETGLLGRCERIRSRKATLEEIQSCHSEAHTLLFGTNPLNRQKLDMSKFAELPIKSFVRLTCGGIGVDSDTTWNELHTAGAAKMAAGSVIELAFKVATSEIKNGMAVVRPPGHHAEPQQAMGFCFFNSVAIAAKQLRQRLKFEKIMIIDWDVHHGNGTQEIFYDDPHVLYLSLHRHDDGNFFPGTGGPAEVGVDDGIGFTVNIAWSGALNPPMGDAEYLAAFRTVVMPIAKDFDPEVVLVSAGFDAAAGHPAPLGGYKVSPACFGHLTRQLLQLAGGKVVLALEGGYDLPAICDASQECVKALLGDDLPPIKEEEITRKPCAPAVEALQNVLTIQAPHWPCIKRWAHTVGYSYLEAQQKEKEEVETVTALASLSMAYPAQPHLQTQDEIVEQEEPMDEDQEPK